MALMKAFTTGIRALAPYSSSKLLGNASRAVRDQSLSTDIKGYSGCVSVRVRVA